MLLGIGINISGSGGSPNIYREAGFASELKKTIVPQRSAVGTTTSFTRADGADRRATVTDWEGLIRSVKDGEARFQNALRVENRVPTISNNLTTSDALIKANATVTATTVALTVADASYFYITVSPSQSWQNNRLTVSAYVTSTTTQTVRFRFTGNGSAVGATGADFALVAGVQQRIEISASSFDSTVQNLILGVENRSSSGATNTAAIAQITFTDYQLEETNGQSSAAAREYVSVGVESSPYHGAGVDGVEYFDTEPDGTPLSGCRLLNEPTRTQYLGVTDAPATQTTASLGTGTYTLWVNGTGSALASGGTATITGAAAATEGSPDQFVVTVAGTVTVTVTGSLTRFQLENGGYETSYIPNAGAAGTSVTRAIDVLAWSSANNISGTAGTVSIEVKRSHLNAAAGSNDVIIGTGITGTNGIHLLIQGTTGVLFAHDGTAFRNLGLTLTNDKALHKLALAWSGSTMKACMDGTLGSAATFDGDFSHGGFIVPGHDTAVPTNHFAGEQGNIRIWQRALSDSELQAITT